MSNNNQTTESGINPQSKFVNQVRTNTKSDLIEITEDKLENILLKYLGKLNKVKGWLTPFSLFVTILIVLLTAEFKIFLGISKEIWNAFFILALLITFIWTLKSAYDAIKCSKNSTIDFLISEIKNHKE
jgi:uncharacterized membrane protein YqjE